MSKVKIWKIWIGENPIPDHFKQYTDTWERIKGGEVVEINNQTINRYIPSIVFDKLRLYFNHNNQLINHYVRYYLMYYYGGIYLDLDVEIIKDSEIWYNEKPTFFCETSDWFNNHIMICNREYDKLIYHKLMELTKSVELWKDKPEINTGPGLITKVLNETDPSEYNLYSPEYTTPWNWNEKPDRSRITENTIAVHHFYHSWKK